LGIFNIIWYNLVYTPLKRITPLAVIPGSLIGAVPAIMGWVAAGGNIADRQILILSVFLIIWQIPHFWLILMKHNSDYEKAGFPGIERIFSEKNIRYIIFSWLLATVFSSVLLTVSGFISHTATIIILIAGNLIIIYFFFTHIFNRNQIHLKKLIISINLYMFFVVSLAICNNAF
jgi:protoheme IX farnesyltransferase